MENILNMRTAGSTVDDYETLVNARVVSSINDAVMKLPSLLYVYIHV